MEYEFNLDAIKKIDNSIINKVLRGEMYQFSDFFRNRQQIKKLGISTDRKSIL